MFVPVLWRFFSEPFSVFRGKFGGRFAVVVRCCPLFPCVGSFRPCFRAFSVCPRRVLRSTAFRRTCFQLLQHRALHLLGIPGPFRPWLREPQILFLTRLRSPWLKRFNSPCHPSSLRFARRISLPRFPVRPFPLFPALFPVLFPARPWLLPARFPPLQVHLYAEVAVICDYVSRHFLHPWLLLGPPGSFDLSSDYGVACYQLFFAWRKFGSVRRQGVCGWPGSRSHPGKIGEKKITSGEFVELADLLSTNLRAVDLEPQSFLDGKLLVSRKRRLVEVEDILTWTEAFTIYQMVICASHPHRWSDLTKYKLLIIQTARHAPGRSWLEYDTAFRKDAAATGASDWSRMNLDLYNFHLRSSVPPSSLPSSSGPPPPVATSRGSSARPPYCHSWNRGQ